MQKWSYSCTFILLLFSRMPRYVVTIIIHIWNPQLIKNFNHIIQHWIGNLNIKSSMKNWMKVCSKNCNVLYIHTFLSLMTCATSFFIIQFHIGIFNVNLIKISTSLLKKKMCFGGPPKISWNGTNTMNYQI